MDEILMSKSSMDGKILSMDWKISSMDEIILSMDKVFSVEKIMDDLFICGYHPWIKSTDKDNR